MANKRQRRLLTSIVSTVVGIIALVGLGLVRQSRDETDLADPRAGVTTEFQHRVAEKAPALEFRDVADDVGVQFQHGPGERGRRLPEDTGSGVAWGDYDGDGDDDLYLVNFHTLSASPAGAGGNGLFRNDGGVFVEVTARAGVADLDGFGMGASFADFDDDGDLDLFVANLGADRLFLNRGDGTFEDVTQRLGVDNESWSIAGVWGDFDRDGLLDLYVTSYVDYDAGAPEVVETDEHWQAVPFTLNPNSFDPMPNRLYRQRPGGGFEEVALVMGVSDPGGRSLAASFLDVDDDGWLDLYVANDVSPNALFHNRGSAEGFAVFEDWSAVTGSADERGSMGISVADVSGMAGERDGRPDLFISHWVAQENALYVATEGPSGRLEYRDRIRQYRLGEVSTARVGWGTAFADLDLDGRLDLLIANGSTLEDERHQLEAQLPFVFWNGGDRFYDVTAQSGVDVAEPRVARGLAVSDFDLDGDPDFVMSVNRGRALLFENVGLPGGGWIAVRLASSEARALGAKVELSSGAGIDRRFQGADVSFASSHGREQLFGIGSSERATLRVSWLGGRRDTIRDVSANRRVVLRPARSAG